jgi:hypothetical protein
MAVRALTQPLAHAPLEAASVPPAALALTLAAPALDLFFTVQPFPGLAFATSVTSAAATAALLVIWLRFPRASWLFAASLAAIASLVMRLIGADVAPVLSLLTVVALGVGGAFASTELSLEGA